jgi:hypothetical protein
MRTKRLERGRLVCAKCTLLYIVNDSTLLGELIDHFPLFVVLFYAEAML